MLPAADRYPLTPPRFSHVVDVSSYQYYSALLEFLQVPCLQSCIMQGIVQSVTSGTEDLMRLSRLALVRTVSGSFPGMGVAEVLDTLVTLLEDTCTDDRQATPILETIAFILEQHVGEERGSGSKIPARKLWNIVRKAHFKSTNIRKLEAAVKIYEALAVQGDMRRNALTKLRDLLLHPYPTVSCGHEVAVLPGKKIHSMYADCAACRSEMQLLMRYISRCRTSFF